MIQRLKVEQFTYVQLMGDFFFHTSQSLISAELQIWVREPAPSVTGLVKQPAAGSVWAMECMCIICSSLDFKFTHTHTHLDSHQTNVLLSSCLLRRDKKLLCFLRSQGIIKRNKHTLNTHIMSVHSCRHAEYTLAMFNR